MGVIEDFLERYNRHDWVALAACFSAEGYQRIGPFGDTISSSSEYVDFLARVVPTLGSMYRLSTERVVYAEHSGFAELIEHFEVDGAERLTPEVIIFDFDAEGLISGMHLYVQRPGEVPPAGGRAAMGRRDY